MGIGQQWKHWKVKPEQYDLKTNHTLSWTDFVNRFVLSIDKNSYIDMHHKPVSHLCPVCVDYDYIVRTETLTAEMSYFTKKIGADFLLEKNIRANTMTAKNS